MAFYVVCTDVLTGKPVYKRVDKADEEGFLWMRASASMPMVSTPVNVGGYTLLYAFAGRATATRITVNGLKTVNRLCKYFSTSGLTRSARAAEKIGVGELVVFHLILQYIGNSVLTANVTKRFRSPFSV